MDYFSAVLGRVTPDLFYQYMRGTLIGQDFSNPLGQPYPWLHADVSISERSTQQSIFCTWSLSNLKGRFYNLGAPAGVLNPSHSSLFDYFVYTDDSGGTGIKIKMFRNVGRNLAPSSSGLYLPTNVNEALYNQDNPHIERYDSSDPNKLVLFYDSDNKPGTGGHDMWFSTSADGGTTWANPQNVSTLNTSEGEKQPHLYWDGSVWWLYYAALNTSDSKLAIWRARQGAIGNWASWQPPELVVSAGSSFAVGEPTLTLAGDLSFVVVTENTSGGTSFDRYDIDAWFAKKK